MNYSILFGMLIVAFINTVFGYVWGYSNAKRIVGRNAFVDGFALARQRGTDPSVLIKFLTEPCDCPECKK